MNKRGPIIIIEDDLDDQAVLTEIFQKLNYPNKVLFFSDGEKALAHISASKDLPFLILSDINLPKLNGFELREKLKTDAELNIKCIPYLFFSTAANQKSVIDAYSMSVQDFSSSSIPCQNWKKRSKSSWSTGKGVQPKMIIRRTPDFGCKSLDGYSLNPYTLQPSQPSRFSPRWVKFRV